MRKIFLGLGVVLAIIVAAGVFLFLQSMRPTLVEVPLAISDIPAGTVLKANLFRVAKLSNVDRQTLSKWVLVGDWNKADGKVATSDVRAGFPLAKAQIDPNSSNAMESRLSLVLNTPTDYYIVIPINPNDTGNYIQPNDRVDLVVSFGAGEPKDPLTLGITGTTPSAMDGTLVSSTLPLSQTILPPISKLVMQNMQVLRIDRETVKAASDSEDQTALPIGNVQRMYVKVSRDQLEILSFVLNNGRHNIAVRSYVSGQEVPPTDGVTWDDFVRWFYAQRGNDADGVQPYNAISPSEPKLTLK